MLQFPANFQRSRKATNLNLNLKALYKEAFDPKSNQYSHCVQLRNSVLCQEYGAPGSEICMSLRCGSVCTWGQKWIMQKRTLEVRWVTGKEDRLRTHKEEMENTARLRGDLMEVVEKRMSKHATDVSKCDNRWINVAMGWGQQDVRYTTHWVERKKTKTDAKFVVLTGVKVKFQMFWYVTLCSLVFADFSGGHTAFISRVKNSKKRSRHWSWMCTLLSLRQSVTF